MAFLFFVLISREVGEQGKNNTSLMQSRRQHIHSHITPHTPSKPEDLSLMNYINNKLFTQL